MQDVDKKLVEYLKLSNRKDFEADSFYWIKEGMKRFGLKNYIPSPFIVSMITFLKWYYNVESAAIAQSRAKKDGIEEYIAIYFKNEKENMEQLKLG